MFNLRGSQVVAAHYSLAISKESKQKYRLSYTDAEKKYILIIQGCTDVAIMEY